MKEDPFSPTALAKARVAILRVGSAFQGSYELLNDAEEYVAGQTLPRRDDCINALTDVGLAVSLYMPLLLTDSTPQPAALASPAVESSPGRTELAPLTPPRGGGGGGGGGGGRGREPPAKSAPSLAFRADVGLLVSFFTAPAPAFGFAAHGGPSWRFVSLTGGIRLEFSLPEGTDTIHVTTSRVLGEVVPCLHFGWFFGCGVIQAGVLIPRVQTPSFVHISNALSVSAGGRLGVQFRRPPFFPSGLAPFVSIDAMGAVRRSDIFIGDFPHKFLWRGSPFTAAIVFGFGYSFSP